MEKKTINKFGKHYLLGKRKNGQYLWLEEPTFNCGWYWSGCYLHEYTNNKQPTRSRDISMHTHFDSEFLNKGCKSYDTFREAFSETVLREEEIWKLLELVQTFYALKESAELFYRGGSHITRNDCYDIIKDDTFYSEIIKVKIPAVLEAIVKLLGGTTTKEQFAAEVNI